MKTCSILLALYDFKTKPWYVRAFARLCLAGSHKIFVEGQNGRQDILDLGIHESRIVVYQHWCDHSIYKPKKEPNKIMTVLCAGRLSMEMKGIHIVKKVESLMAKERIKFIYAQNVPHQDMPKIYQMADVVVIPSVYSEGIPLVAIEAASSGCALIVTDKGTLPEVVRDFGVVLKEPYEDSLQAYLALFLEKPEALRYSKEMSLNYSRLKFSRMNARVFIKECR